MRGMKGMIGTLVLAMSFVASPAQDAVGVEGRKDDSIKVAKIEERLSKLSQDMKRQEGEIKRLSKGDKEMRTEIDDIKNDYRELESAQKDDSTKVSEEIASVNGKLASVNGKIEKTNNAVGQNTSAIGSRSKWGIGIALFIAVFIVVAMLYVRRRMKKGDTSIAEVRKAQDALQTVQVKLQEDSVKLDKTLLDVMEKQIAPQQVVTSTGEPDHSLALKVANEVVRIEVNLSRMDASVKGYKQLLKAVQRMKDNLKANGYEIVDMIGKPYDEGMRVVASFVPDDRLPAGQQVITGITKPQVNYNGEMVQAGEITVSQNI